MDALKVVALSTTFSLIIETALWLLQYRTAAFKSLKGQIERQSRKLEELKAREAMSGARLEKRRKKEERLEAGMKKDVIKTLGPQRLYTGLVTVVFMMVFYNIMTTLFGGVPVAKLPFEPVSFISKLSHRGLPGNDLTDCSVAFVYALCQMGIRPVVSKLLGWGPSRAMNSVNAAVTPQFEQVKRM